MCDGFLYRCHQMTVCVCVSDVFLISDGPKSDIQHSVHESARPPRDPCPPRHHQSRRNERGTTSGAGDVIRGSDAPAGLRTRSTTHAGVKESVSRRGEDADFTTRMVDDKIQCHMLFSSFIFRVTTEGSSMEQTFSFHLSRVST